MKRSRLNGLINSVTFLILILFSSSSFALAVDIAYGGALTAASYTNINSDGNRYTRLRGSMPQSDPLRINLREEPRWILGHENLWLAVLKSGSVQAFTIDDRKVEEVLIRSNVISPGGPPALFMDTEGYKLLSSELSSPVLSGKFLAENRAGELHVDGSVMAEDMLADSRVLADNEGTLLALSGPTDIYRHSVLGDDIEATGITLVSDRNMAREIVGNLAAGTVIENNSAIWADLNGDGVREIILTLSNAKSGSRLAVYDNTGGLMAEGEPVGRANRWRHQIAVAPFGPEGELELADVLTPHINGKVEFFRIEGDKLQLMSSIAGYSSHSYGSRNLDMAVAGDFDSDGHVELLLPDQSLMALAAIRHSKRGAIEAWRIPLGGRITTNVAIGSRGGMAAVGVGTDNREMLIWLPQIK